MLALRRIYAALGSKGLIKIHISILHETMFQIRLSDDTYLHEWLLVLRNNGMLK